MLVYSTRQLDMFYDPGVKVDYLYGLAGPDDTDLYDMIKQYVIDKGLVDGIKKFEDLIDLRVLDAFYRRIEKLSGFPAGKLRLQIVWDPDSKKQVYLIVFARDKAPDDKELIDQMKLAFPAIKKELQIEGREKWYVGENEQFDEESFPETGKFDTPPCFT